MAARLLLLGLFLLLSLVFDAHAGGISLSADQVHSIVIGYSWTGFSSTPVQNERLIITRTDERWTRRVILRDGANVNIREPLDDEMVMRQIMQIASTIEKGAPTMGLQTCENHTDDYPRYDVRIMLRDAGAILLKSTSNCLQTLPWNVTDGKQLYVNHQENLSEAVFALVGRRTSRGMGPGPEAPPVMGSGPVTFDVLFAALQNELNRLLVENASSALRTDLHIGHLAAALTWMDRERFRESLQHLAQSLGTAEKVRRHLLGLIERLSPNEDPTAVPRAHCAPRGGPGGDQGRQEEVMQ